MVCFICHKIGPLARECRNQSYNRSEDNNRFSKKKEKNDLKGKKTIEEVRNEMKKKWIKKEEGKEGEGHFETRSSFIGDDSSSSN